MKIVLTGRPGSVEKRPEVVITTMSHVAAIPNLASGIPIPPQIPTLYTIYMTPNQWALVENSIQDPEDKLHIEGVTAPDPESNGMAVFVGNIRSELMSLKHHEAQLAAAPPKPPKAPKVEKPVADPAPVSPTPPSAQPSPAKPPKKSRFDDIGVESVVPKPSVLPAVGAGVPPEIAPKLSELYASANLFKQKVASILAKPKDQQFGLEMTQKLLKNVEDEIAAIESKFKK